MAITVTVNSIDFTFDFITQIIDVDASVSVLDVYDLWVAIRTAAGTSTGIAYPAIAKAGGLDTLDSAQGIQTFITVTLFDGWEVNSLRGSGKFTLSGGNLLREDGNDPFVDNPLITYFAFFSQAGTVTTVATGSGVTPQDKIDIANLNRQEMDSNSVELAAIRSGVEAVPSAAENADALLDRAIQGGANGGRTVRDVMRANRNRVVVDPALLTITVYEEDDTTVAWSGAIATGARDSINSVDPA